ncbi:hypothetical protein [Candidatus Stoquefichus massiliensis]|uniref:hypothetical protein n=1 Tax=Candidatus Stoquefichus massiliensis TaxID=1470350 RepID=UPI000487444A|nr:hypothetical protein [Candidatus Stoquefichus massiliensis]
MKNMVTKYVFTLFGLLVICTLIHFSAIAPMIESLCIDDICSGVMSGFSLLIAEPIICVLIVVWLINRKENQYYDSIS